MHGLESRLFQLEKEECGVGKECSHEKRMEASWFGAAKVVVVKKKKKKKRNEIKNDEEERL